MQNPSPLGSVRGSIPHCTLDATLAGAYPRGARALGAAMDRRWGSHAPTRRRSAEVHIVPAARSPSPERLHTHTDGRWTKFTVKKMKNNKQKIMSAFRHVLPMEMCQAPLAERIVGQLF